jgi:hypothetical protein
MLSDALDRVSAGEKKQTDLNAGLQPDSIKMQDYTTWG